jgi:hypothetical protein
MQLTYTIPDEQAIRLFTAINGLYPKPAEVVETDEAWAKKAIGQWLEQCIARYEEATARSQAATQLESTDNLVTLVKE